MHERLQRLESDGNRLTLNGTPLSDYLSGSSQPHYVYSRDQICNTVCELRAQLPSDIKLHYAIKANPMAPLVDFMATQVDGLDVASAGELDIALAAAVAPQHISFAGPAKQIFELDAALEAGVVINVESSTELARIQQLAQDKGRKALVALRVNPDFELKQSGMQMAGGAKPFGIDAEQIPLILDQLDPALVDLCGLHIFAGSQNLDADAIVETHRQTFALAEQLLNVIAARGLATKLRHINIGGGFGIPYFAGQPRLAIAPVGESLQQLMAARSGVFGQLDIVLELGRYLVGEAGYYVCQITDIKQSRGKTFYMVNGGLHHHLANSGNFGQVIRKNYPVVLADKLDQGDTQVVDVAGPLCTPLDVVAAKIALPKAVIGDYVVVLQSGAYGYSASPLGFLGHQAPKQLLI